LNPTHADYRWRGLGNDLGAQTCLIAQNIFHNITCDLGAQNIVNYFVISTSQESSNILVKHFITMSFNLSTKFIYKISCFANSIKMVEKIGCQMKERKKKKQSPYFYFDF